MRNRSDDYYSALGLLRSAAQHDIRRAYLRAAKRLHPDTNNGPGETEMFLDVQKAYQVLSDPSRRAAYDATLPPEEEIIPIVKQRILVSRKELSAQKDSQLVYLLIDLSPADDFKKMANSIPLNICLVLDCSTSMKGEKLDKVKATAIQLIQKLSPQDIFSLVTFNDRAEVVIPATRQANQHKMENRIQLVQTSGGTEILYGLRAGLEEVSRYRNPAFINHIIVLTDGHTYGDEQACYDLAKEAAQRGIGISGLGIGSEWNDIFLDQLAGLTGGHTMLVSQPNDIELLLKDKFSTLSNTFAEKVTLEYELDDGIEISYAFRLQPETDPLMVDNPLRLGPIIQSWPLSILIEFIIRPEALRDDYVTLIHGRMEVSVNAIDTPAPPIPLNITLSVKDNITPAAPPPPIIQALSKLTLYRLQEKARNEAAAGNYDKATEHLQRLATHLLSQGQRSLAKTIMLEIESIEKDNSYSANGEKKIKYGTRALLWPEEKKS
jgi:Ca-activated chloride channel family protein